MQHDFYPGSADSLPETEHRVANALEYIAFQLGQINRKLDKIVGDE